MSRTIQPITVDIIMGIGMRYLTGSHKNTVRHVFGVSMTECQRSALTFIDGLTKCKALDICMPRTAGEWDLIRREFKQKSRDGIMNGCIGCIDGLLQKTLAPKYTEVPNVRAYYSGHYEHYGLNCQGVCDARLRFLFFGVVGAGSMNDNIAYTMCGSLPDVISNLPPGLFIVGDAAYSLSDKVLIPFTGSQADVKENDTFNFYLSQVRIRIEMAFGLLVNRFRILKRPLEMSLCNNAKTIMACARLHNYIIEREGLPITLDIDNEDGDGESVPHGRQTCVRHNGVIDVDRVGGLVENVDDISNHDDGNCNTGNVGNMAYAPTMLEEDYEALEGVSVTRTTLVEFLRDEGYRRPLENLLRNGRLPEEGDMDLNRDDLYEHIPHVDCAYFHPW